MSSDSNSKKLKFFLLSNKRKDADGSVVGKLKEKIESMGHVCECRDEGSNLEIQSFYIQIQRMFPKMLILSWFLVVMEQFFRHQEIFMCFRSLF